MNNENNTNGSDLPSAPPPAYDSDSPPNVASPCTDPVGLAGSKVGEAPSYTEPLPYPHSSGDVTAVSQAIPMVDMGLREPPPPYRSDAEVVEIVFPDPPSVEELNNDPETPTADYGQATENEVNELNNWKMNAAMIAFIFVSLTFIAMIVGLILLFLSWN